MSIVNSKSSGPNYKWYVLSLAALTFTFTFAMQQICMTVLFKEISDDLGLSLVEVGVVWGIPPLAALFIVFIGGLLADRYGAKRIMSIACLLAGLAGAMRGVSGDFASLTLTTFLFGLSAWIIPSSVFKTTATWFSGRQLMIANGIVSAGVGFGFTVGAMISATILSPLLGGWRNVLFLYGAISIVVGLLCLLTMREPERLGSAGSEGSVPLRQAIARVFPIKGVWLLGLTLLGYIGCTQGVVGYLPLYLRDNGWTVASADGTLAAFNGVSTLGAIPLALLANRLGLRKAILFPVLLITIVGVALLPVVDNAMVWVLMIMVGIARDGFMAICLTMSTETEGVGVVYAGTAIGLVQTILNVGSFISPPLGNSLADTNPGLPFFLWAAFGLLALLAFCFVRETEWKQHPQL
ncbi:MAG: MFS transporter [Dehalococcoidia bacterium]|nr:MFS transporter [Dehalococcoidia bacterium]